ncbi:DsbA family protein [bacterium]|nr:DsbA family protein [bacterium]
MRIFPFVVAAFLSLAAKPVHLVEWVDFKCPFCSQFASETLPLLQDKFGDDLIIEIRQLPIESLHKGATLAAEASVCAEDGGFFWAFHDALFHLQGEPTLEGLLRLAQPLEGDYNAYSSCLRFGGGFDRVATDLESAIRQGIRSTPFFFIDEIPIAGNLPTETFVSLIEKALDIRTPLKLVDIDPPIQGVLRIDSDCGAPCQEGISLWLERTFPTLDLKRAPAPDDIEAYPWSPYLEVDTAIAGAFRFSEVARRLIPRGERWVLRPSVFGSVYLRRAPIVENRPTRGEGPTAVFYTSFTCPYCAQEARLLGEVQKEAPFRLVFKHFIRVQEDIPLAVAAECIWQQGGDTLFWPFFDALLTNRPRDEAALNLLFATTGLPTTTRAECAEDPLILDAIRTDQTEADLFGIDATPATVLGRTLHIGLVDKKQILFWAQGGNEDD